MQELKQFFEYVKTAERVEKQANDLRKQLNVIINTDKSLYIVLFTEKEELQENNQMQVIDTPFGKIAVIKDPLFAQGGFTGEQIIPRKYKGLKVEYKLSQKSAILIIGVLLKSKEDELNELKQLIMYERTNLSSYSEELD